MIVRDRSSSDRSTVEISDLQPVTMIGVIIIDKKNEIIHRRIARRLRGLVIFYRFYYYIVTARPGCGRCLQL